MKKISYLVLVVLSGLMISAVSAVGFPEAEISNGILHARLYLPDSEKGYYRSTRFIGRVTPMLEYKGHKK